MKVLFITEKFPHPLDTGGNVRTFHILRMLSEAHDVVLLATTTGDVLPENIAAVSQYCTDIRLVKVEPASPLHELVALTKSTLTGEPFLLRRRFFEAFESAVASIWNEAGPFDAVHFNHLDALLYAHALPKTATRVVDEHNIVSNQVATTLHTESRWLRRLLLRLDYSKMRSWETRACNEANLCFVCSDVDAATLTTFGVRSKIVSLPNGVDTDYFSVRGPEVDPHEMAFVGTLDYDPCEKGVWFFCREILPLIKAHIPGARFTVVGKNPSKRLRTLAERDQSIVLKGRVDDVREHVGKAAVFVVPLLSGSGTRLKILEAMSMGIPIVSTTIGAEGITASDNTHLRLADSASAFATAVLDVMRNPGQHAAMTTRARQLVEERYSWEALRATLLEAYGHSGQ